MQRKQRMLSIIQQQLSPFFLIIEDESAKHHVPAGGETHFKVTVVSDQFHAVNRLARHRLLNSLFAAEFNRGLHALSLHLYTQDEWQKSQQNVPNSPHCHNGYHQDHH